MRTKEVENAIKEGKDYIEFMTTAGDNVEWAKTVLSYIEKLEEKCETEFKRGVEVKFADTLKSAKQLSLENHCVPKLIIRERLKELEDKVQELTDEQGYWGGQTLLDKIEFLEDLLGE